MTVSKCKVLVTGAGSGIGHALVRELAGRGHEVIAVSRNAERLKGLAKALPDGAVHVVPADITTDEGITEVTRQIAMHGGRLQVLVNCAGRLINKPFEELSLGDWEEVYRTNVIGMALLIRGVLPMMKSENGEPQPHIVNVSSMGGVQGSMKFAGLSAYSSSKAAVCGLTECLAEEFKEIGVKVNALAIGESGSNGSFYGGFRINRAGTVQREDFTGVFINALSG
jgi:NAD(P)-dependent dehydrogenase (short-subunit alcohol dehydrogenase family)